MMAGGPGRASTLLGLSCCAGPSVCSCVRTFLSARQICLRMGAPGLACSSFVSALTTVLGTLRAPMRDNAAADSFSSSSLPASGLPSARLLSSVSQNGSAVPDT